MFGVAEKVTVNLNYIDQNGKSKAQVVDAFSNMPVKYMLDSMRLNRNSHMYKGTQKVYHFGDTRSLISHILKGQKAGSFCQIDMGCRKMKKLPGWNKDHLEMKNEVKNQEGQLYFTVVISGYALKARISMLSNSIISQSAAELCDLESNQDSYLDVEIQIDEYRMGGLTLSSGAYRRISDDCDLTLGLDFLSAYNAKYNFKTGHLTINDTFTVQGQRDTAFEKVLDYNNLSADHVHSTDDFPKTMIIEEK